MSHPTPIELSRQDEAMMRLALAQAEQAQAEGEVPVGAVLVRHGQVLATGRNRPIQGHDPSAHAEIEALRAGAQLLGNYRLEDCSLYVTLEPCAMCSGAMLHARLSRVVYGTPDPRTGAAGSVLNLFDDPRLNHQTTVQGGVLAEACAAQLKAFFKPLRRNLAPLREDALRLPEVALPPGPGSDGLRHWAHDVPALGGLRMAYTDTGPQDATCTWVALHAPGAWSHQFRHWLPIWQAAGHRVLLPDLPGFGRSDRPKRESAHRLAWHAQVLHEWLDGLNPNGPIVCLGLGPTACLALQLAQRWRQRGPAHAVRWVGLWPERALPDAGAGRARRASRDEGAPSTPAALRRQLRAQGLPDEAVAATMAAMPDAGHAAGLRAWAALDPALPDGEWPGCHALLAQLADGPHAVWGHPASTAITGAWPWTPDMHPDLGGEGARRLLTLWPD